jgi:hypothetical protein
MGAAEDAALRSAVLSGDLAAVLAALDKGADKNGKDGVRRAPARSCTRTRVDARAAQRAWPRGDFGSGVARARCPLSCARARADMTARRVGCAAPCRVASRALCARHRHAPQPPRSLRGRAAPRAVCA